MKISRKEYKRKYRINNKKKISEYDKQYYLDNKKVKKEYNEQYYIDNRENLLKSKKQYYIDNKNELLEWRKQTRKNYPEKVKKYDQKANNKRRDLGFIPLNEPFNDCEGHHISQNFVIYMPEELHKSIWHCLWTGKNMDAINKLAIEFI